MDFSGQTLLLARMAADMDALADNKTEKLLVRCTSNEGFIAGMAAMIKVGGELRATLPLFVVAQPENLYFDFLKALAVSVTFLP